jgi:hypothetical protein
MDDELRRQPIPGRQARLARRTPWQLGARGSQLRSGSAMDGAAHAAAGRQVFVSGVDDRIDLKGRDVNQPRFDSHVRRA